MENHTSQRMKMKRVAPLPHTKRISGCIQKKGGGLALPRFTIRIQGGGGVTTVYRCKRKYYNLNILSLNCCGLQKGLNYPGFQDLVKKHDILCLQETKTDDQDVIEINGFKIKMKNRVKYCRLNSGGIIPRL